MSSSPPTREVSDSVQSERICIGRTITLRRCRLAPEQARRWCARHKHQQFSIPILILAIAAVLFAWYRGAGSVVLEQAAVKTPPKVNERQVQSRVPRNNEEPRERPVGVGAANGGRPVERSDRETEGDNVVVPDSALIKPKALAEAAVDLAENHNDQGRQLHSENEFESAVEAFDRAIEIYSRLVEEGQEALADEFASVLHNRGSSLMAQGQLDDALRDFDKAIASTTRLIEQERRTDLANDLAAMLNNRGLALFSQSKFDGAMKDYDKAIEIYIDLIEQERQTDLREYLVNALGNRGLTLHEQGMIFEAITDLSRAVEILEVLTSEGRTEFDEKLVAARRILADLKSEALRG